jgi:hypothetical protein
MKKSMTTGFIISVAGFLFTLIFAILVFQKAFFVIQSQKTTGRVSDMVIRSKKNTDGTTVQTAYPVISFKNEKGEEQSFELSPSYAQKYRIGQRIPLRYKPGHDPKSARITGTFLQTWGIVLFSGIMGFILDCIGLPLLMIQLKKKS